MWFGAAPIIALLGLGDLDQYGPHSQRAVWPHSAQDSANVTICAAGDVTLGTNLGPSWTQTADRRHSSAFLPRSDPDVLLRPLRDIPIRPHILLLNIEGAIGDQPITFSKCSPASRHCFAFRQPASVAGALARIGNDLTVVANVANNHSRDAGESGFRATLQLLARAGVAVTGSDTLATPVALSRGDTVAFLGFHTSVMGPDARDTAAVRRHVSRASKRWSRVVVTAHIGAEGRGAQRTRNVTEMFLGADRGNAVAFARTAVSAGADFVAAHGPHVLRGGEWVGGRPVFYSLGNLITYGPFNISEPMNRGAIACISMGSEGSSVETRVFSTMQSAPGDLSFDADRRSLRLIDSLSALDFGRTGFAIDSLGWVRKR